MIRKPIRIAVKAAILALALVAIVVGALMWRLYLGPVEAGFVSREVRAGLARALPGMSVRVGRIRLIWPENGFGLPVRSEDLRILAPDGSEIAHFSELVVTLAPFALMFGNVRLQSVRVVEPEIALERGVAGDLTLQSGPARAAGQGRLFAMLGDRMSGAPDEAASFGALPSIEIVGADITLTDAATRRVWRASPLRSALTHGADGLAARLSFTLQTGGMATRIAGTGTYRPERGTVRGTLTFDALDPSVLASAWKPLAALGNLKMKLAGRAAFAGSDSGRFESASLDIESGAGTIRVPGVYRAPLRVRGLRAAIKVKDGGRSAEIERLRADLGITAFTLKGRVAGGKGTVRFDGRAGLGALDLAGLRRLWPARIGGNARRWVGQNVPRGRMTGLEAELGLAVRSGSDGPSAQLARISGRFGFAGVDLRLPGTLPPLRKAGGEARFDAKKIVFRLGRGRIGPGRIGDATVRLAGLDGKGERVTLAATVEGAVADLLREAGRHAPVSAQELGVDPAAIRGQARIALKASFPPTGPLALRDVALSAGVDLRDVAWPEAPFGLDLAGGRFRLDIDKAGLRLKGGGRIAGGEAQLAWHEKFGRVGESWRRRLSVEGTVSPEALGEAGRVLRPFVAGPVGVEVAVTGRDDGRTVADAKYEFREARLTLPGSGIVKPPNVPAHGSSRVVLQDGRLAAIPAFALQSAPLALRGRARFEPGGRTLRTLTVDRLTAGRTRLAVAVGRRGKAGRPVRLTGSVLDLAPLLARRPAAPKRKKPKREEAGGAGLSASERLNLTLAVERMYVTRELPLWSARGSARVEGGALRRLRLGAKLPSGKPLALRIRPARGGQEIVLTAGDGGGALRALGIVDRLRGGALSVRALRRNAAGAGGNRPVSGVLQLENFRVERVPAILRFFSSIERRSVGRSLFLKRLEMNFALRGDRVEIRNGRAYSNLVGVTGSGRIDQAKRTVALRGTFVPLYAVNSVFGRVPLIGDFLVGEKGSGLLAARFTVSGSLDRPKFNVNPVSLLTPGAIRRLFDAKDDDR